jgi:hypothetical protein
VTLLVFPTTVSAQAAHGSGSLVSADWTAATGASSPDGAHAAPTSASEMIETAPTFLTNDVVMTRLPSP